MMFMYNPFHRALQNFGREPTDAVQAVYVDPAIKPLLDADKENITIRHCRIRPGSFKLK